MIVAVAFASTFVITVVLCLVMLYILERRRYALPRGVKASTPFPAVMPVVAAPPSAPDENVCLNLVGDASGRLVQSPLERLTPCNVTSDCATCTTYPVPLTLACVAADPTTARLQTKLGNKAAKFCMPAPRACITPELLPCTHDAECARCTEGADEQMRCQVVRETQKLVPRDGGAELTIPAGQYCLPSTPASCNAENGAWQWTTDGWTCVCHHPSVWGGESCETLIACSNNLTTPWSASRQQLLHNRPGGGVWSADSGVNPEGCHLSSGITVPCGTTGALPNTVCRCDGLMKGSFTAFRNDPLDPLACAPDNCSVNALGGATRASGLAATWAPRIPASPCICSGADSRAWVSDPNQNTDDGYRFTGWCTPRVPGTRGAQVTVPAGNPSALPHHAVAHAASCAVAENRNPAATSLVPGFADDADGTASVAVCSVDPCRGKYNDPSFQPPASVRDLGHFDPSAGACACVEGTVAFATASCNFTTNPVCNSCVDACSEMANPDPTKRPCQVARCEGEGCDRKVLCRTTTEGAAECVCSGDYALASDGRTCVRRFAAGTSCKGYVGQAVCETPGAHCLCHTGRDNSVFGMLGDCRNTRRVYAMCSGNYDGDLSALICRDGTNLRQCGGTKCPEEEGCS